MVQSARQPEFLPAQPADGSAQRFHQRAWPRQRSERAEIKMDQRYALASNCHEGPGRNLILLHAFAASEIKSSCWILLVFKSARKHLSASTVLGGFDHTQNPAATLDF